jgi:hypothetical protein
VEDAASEENLSARQDESLQEILLGCHALLNDMTRLVTDFSTVESVQVNLGGKARRVWKRLKWDPNEVRDLRARLISTNSLLHSYLSSLSG